MWKKKCLGFFLALCIMVTSLPTNLLAAEPETPALSEENPPLPEEQVEERVEK